MSSSSQSAIPGYHVCLNETAFTDIQEMIIKMYKYLHINYH